MIFVANDPVIGRENRIVQRVGRESKKLKGTILHIIICEYANTPRRTHSNLNTSFKMHWHAITYQAVREKR